MEHAARYRCSPRHEPRIPGLTTPRNHQPPACRGLTALNSQVRPANLGAQRGRDVGKDTRNQFLFARFRRDAGGDEELLEGLAFERLLLDELFGDGIERTTMLLKHRPSATLGLVEDAGNLGIYLSGHLLGIRGVPERTLAEGDGSQGIAHAVASNHLAGERSDDG